MGISAKASSLYGLNTLFVRIGIVSFFCLVSFSEAQAQVLKAKGEKVIDGVDSSECSGGLISDF